MTPKAAAARRLAITEPTKSVDLLRDLDRNVAAAIADVRGLVDELRPPVLDGRGLVGALQDYMDTVQTPSGPRLQLSTDGVAGLEHLPESVEVAAYRIVTESLTNVLRHAQADSASVTLWLEDDQLRMKITDNGMVRTQGSAGIGLSSLRERAAALGGRISAGTHCERRRGPGGAPIGGFVITVPVADDHSMVREGLRALLSSMGGYELVGAARTGADALREAVLLKPDLLILDIGFPDLNGIEIVRRLAKAIPSIKILMLTMYDDDESILGAVRAGARVTCRRAPMLTTCYELSPLWQLARRSSDLGWRDARFRLSARPRTLLSRNSRHANTKYSNSSPRPVQPCHRNQARVIDQYDQQPHFKHLWQASGRQPSRGDRPGAQPASGVADPGQPRSIGRARTVPVR